MDIVVRGARIEDTPFIVEGNARMAQEAEGLKLDLGTLEAGVRAALADAHKASYYVAEVQGALAGQLMVTHEWSDWRNGDVWWIQSVYVLPLLRQKGVFRALYLHVRSLAGQAGAVGLRLYVERANASAQRTYERLGMRSTGYLVMEEMLHGG